MPVIGTVAQINPHTMLPEKANVVVPASGVDTFPLPSQQLVTTNLIPVPGVPAAPTIGMGPLGGVAPV